MITKSLELSDAEKRMKVKRQLANYEREQADLEHINRLHKMELEQKREMQRLADAAQAEAKERSMIEARTKAEADMQKVLDSIHTAKLERDKLTDAAAIETEKKLAEIEKAKQDAYAGMVKEIMGAISEDLVAAMTSKSNNEMLVAVSEAMAPWAMAEGESVPNTVNKILRGTPLEGLLEGALTGAVIPDEE